MTEKKVGVKTKPTVSERREHSGRYKHLYTMLLDAIPSAVLLVDKHLRIISVNRSVLEYSQKTTEETIGRRLEEIFPSDLIDQMDIVERIRQVIVNIQPSKWERMTYRAAGMPVRFFYYRLLPFIRENRVEGTLILVNDVTEQAHLMEEMRRMERHLAGVVESASDLIVSVDKKGMILTWNPAAERLSGYLPAEAAKLRFAYLFAEEDRSDIEEILRHTDARDLTRMKECPLLTRKGALIPVSWVFSPLKDSDNRTTGIVAIGRDLTEHQKYELEMYQSQKFAALGVMAGGIAHEIRNPLAICSSSAQFLLDEDVTPEFRRECAEKIYKGIRRTSDIVENLLKYAHPSTTTRKPLIDIVPLIKETQTLVTYQANLFNIKIRASFPKKPVMIEGVGTLLQQVFMNIFLNAIHAMPSGGRLDIDVRTDRSQVHARIADTGCGIPARDIVKIFDPFYTTSPIGKGAGLGLPLCYSIVKQHHGSIDVESVEGRGSIFTVTLPLRHGEGKSRSRTSGKG
ncbi:MAG: PAS domain S-box protein [Deltaproteobacteria bacterium]|nr:PAS domain S-box protein [Deltaproteobacteria bacterium]